MKKTRYVKNNLVNILIFYKVSFFLKWFKQVARMLVYLGETINAYWLYEVYCVCLQENHLPSPVSLRSASVSSDLDATVQSIIDKMETGLEVRVFNPNNWEFA